MVISFFNQKGGVGKTTTALLLSDYFLSKGKRVLLVDLDPQGTLTNVFIDELPLSLWDFFNRTSTLSEIILPLEENRDMLGASIFMANMPPRDSTELLVEKTYFAELTKEYDYVIVDCPPNLGTLARFGLLLADRLFMPVEATKFSYDALKDGLATIKTLSILNENLTLNMKVFQNQSQKNRALKKSYEELFKRDLGKNWMDFSLPNSTKIQERPVTGENYFDKTPAVPVLRFFKQMENFIHGS